MSYSALVERAILAALRLHGSQVRKSDPTQPYVSHLVSVTLLLAAYGFDDEVISAGLLHDTLEDTNYDAEKLEADFGLDVCEIVRAVTEDKSLQWESRKQHYLERIRSGSRQAKAVCCADKIHNLSSLIDRYERSGDEVWSVFRRGKERTLWFYFTALDAIAENWDHPIVDEYRNTVERARKVFGE